ncbi:AraC family transcriptional regulator [Streptomyces sp. NPDC058953]|uniref:AraC family transcriptional regulator n=1 Tax=unclassified Streptomyces TaxID=2593676 RepID=UPI0036BF2BB9
MDDALSSLLNGVRPQGAVFDQSVFNPPWSLRFVERAPVTLLTMLSGDAWIVPDDGEPVPLRHGDLAIVVGPEPYTVADSPDTAPLALIGDARRWTSPEGVPIHDELPMCGPRRDDGPPAEGPWTVLLKGAYHVGGSVSRRVLDALPRIARVPAAAATCPALDMIEHEIGRDVPGQQAVLDRLLELLLVATLREWFDLPGGHAPAWYSAHGDPVVGRALKLIHGDPARPWTVASLAAEAGASRARFARRFTDLVGQPPMAYLTDWRICWAADLLATTDATVDAVSHQVGYANAYALSVAFKRTMGVRPTEHRALARAAEQAEQAGEAEQAHQAGQGAPVGATV